MSFFGHTIQGVDKITGLPRGGCGGPSGMAETPGNDVVITLGCNWDENTDFPTIDTNNLGDIGMGTNAESPVHTGSDKASVGSETQQAATFMHELGHNFDLRHGGPYKFYPFSNTGGAKGDGTLTSGSSVNCKPNYNSIMSYSKQLEDYYPDPSTQYRLDYSEGEHIPFGVLDETDLDEPAGLTGNSGTVVIFGTTGGIEDAPVGPNINWDGSISGVDPNTGAAETGDINNLGIPGCGASPSQTAINDLNDWNHLLYDNRNAFGGSFDNIVPFDTPRRDILDLVNAQNEWFDSLLFYHTLTRTDDVLPFAGDVADISFQFFSGSPENFDLENVGPFVYDLNTIVLQDGFYEQTNPDGSLRNGQENAPAIPLDCEEGDISLRCNPRELVLIDVTGDDNPDREFFIRVARLTDENSANSTPFISPLIGPFEIHKDGTGGFYHLAVNTGDLLMDGGSLAIPGAGKYAFDVILATPSGTGVTEGVGLDLNINEDGPSFQVGDDIFACFDGVFDEEGDPVFAASCPENISGYRQVVGDTKSTAVILVENDAP